MTETANSEPSVVTDCSSLRLLSFDVPAKAFTAILYDMNEARRPVVSWSEECSEMHFEAIANLKRDLIIAHNKLVALTGYKTFDELHEAVGDLD